MKSGKYQKYFGEIEETDAWSRRLSRVGRSAIAASRGRPSRATGAPCDGTRARPRLSGWAPSVADGPEPEDEPDPSAEVAAAPGKLPQLGKEDLERLVEPFERLGSHLLKNIEKPEARIACDQHMETWWLMQRVLQDRKSNAYQGRAHTSSSYVYFARTVVSVRPYLSARNESPSFS